MFVCSKYAALNRFVTRNYLGLGKVPTIIFTDSKYDSLWQYLVNKVNR